MPNEKQGEIINGFIDDFKKENTLVVVDPVMADDGEIYKGFDEKRIAAVCSLAKKADIITPNISELCILCNESLEDIKGEKALEKVEKMAQSFAKENNCCVVVSGIEISPSEIATAVFDKTEFVVIKNRRVGESFSGTGDILCSYLTCELLGGMNLFAAVEEACSFIERALIKTANKNGLNPADGIDMLDKLVIFEYNEYKLETEPQPFQLTCPPIVCYRQRRERLSDMLGLFLF